MSKQYYAVLDQGTSSCRTVIYDQNFQIVGKQSILLTQSYPETGWVEHDPLEIWNATRSTLQQALVSLNITGKDLVSIGITNQRETIVAWNKKTGLPIYNAIVWQDNRTNSYCEKMKDQYQQMIYDKTGLVIAPYFSATKIKWILDNVPVARELIKTNDLMIGTIDTWLLYKLTDSQVFATDYTNASRTMLFNIHTKEWDQDLLDLFGIPKETLAEVHPSSYLYGHTYESFLSKSQEARVPITALAGDQQSSLFGNLCLHEGEAKATFGTGCFILMNIGKKFQADSCGLIISLGCGNRDENSNYILEGSVFNSGNVANWLQNNLKIIYDPRELQFYCDITKDKKPSKELFFVPALGGLGAPYWNLEAQGTIVGLSAKTRREDIVKASLEGIGYQVNDVFSTIHKLGINLKKLYCDGGLSQSNYLMQFTSNMLQAKLMTNQNFETTSLGCAYLSAWTLDPNLIQRLKNDVKQEFNPELTPDEAQAYYKKWQKAVKLAIEWTQND